jgi:hypothetical protein
MAEARSRVDNDLVFRAAQARETMDVFTILAVGVAILTVICAYWLLFGTPDMSVFSDGRHHPRRR